FPVQMSFIQKLQPRERCLQSGPSHLPLKEILAVLIGTGPKGLGCYGVAELILDRICRDLPQDEQERAFFRALEVSPLSSLSQIKGLGKAGQARILCAFELGRRYDMRILTRQDLKPSGLAEKALLKIPNSFRQST